MLPVYRSRRGHRRVNFGAGATAPTPAQVDWRCDPDPTTSPFDSAEIMVTEEARAADQDKDDEEEFTQAPDVLLYFRAGDGGIVSATAASVWHSVVVRDLVSTAGAEEEIPVPKSSTEILTTFLRLCEAYPSCPQHDEAASLRNATEEMLEGLFWMAKLLHLYKVVARPVADVLRVREHLMDILPVDMLFYMVEHSLEHIGDDLTCSIFDRLASDRTRVFAPIRVCRLITPFMNDTKRHVREGALRALQRCRTVEANLILLQHREFGVRACAVKQFRECIPSEDLVRAISSLASSKSFLIKESVANALTEVAPAGNRLAIDVLVSMLMDPAREVRRAAADGLKRVADCDDPELVKRILDIVLSMTANEPLRYDALTVLAVVAPSHRGNIEALAVAMQEDGSTMTKLNAARLLRRLRCSDEVEGISPATVLVPRVVAKRQGSWADESD